MMEGLDLIVNQLVEGFTLIGDAVTAALILLIEHFVPTFKFPEWAARLSFLSVTALLIWRFQKIIPKLILAAVALIAASMLLGFV